MSDRPGLPRLVLALIVAVYVVTAALYALLTPPWQAPDEPAHYNYVRHVAERGDLPVLEAGDYPAQYLEEIKGRQFPPDMPIDQIRYESWQPPLYYVLAAPTYRLALALTVSPLVALRLFSVLWGAMLLVVAYHISQRVLPKQAPVGLGVAALLATVPMHVAMTAAVNNDTLAELWVALIIWQLLGLLSNPAPAARQWVLLGLSMGLGALTKLSTLATAPLAVAVALYIQLHGRKEQDSRASVWRSALTMAVPALVLFAPWVLRNLITYGVSDPLIMARHSAVVVGQLRTQEWLAHVGLLPAAREMLVTTFHSFWGQFGWMGVPIDDRLYLLLSAG